jgi:hypothetical protein
MGLCSSNYSTHKGGVYLFPHTHKTETKRTIKIKTPKTVLRKPNEGKNRKPTRKNTNK